MPSESTRTWLGHSDEHEIVAAKGNFFAFM